jgi:hypothetical protein
MQNFPGLQFVLRDGWQRGHALQHEPLHSPLFGDLHSLNHVIHRHSVHQPVGHGLHLEQVRKIKHLFPVLPDARVSEPPRVDELEQRQESTFPAPSDRYDARLAFPHSARQHPPDVLAPRHEPQLVPLDPCPVVELKFHVRHLPVPDVLKHPATRVLHPLCSLIELKTRIASQPPL